MKARWAALFMAGLVVSSALGACSTPDPEPAPSSSRLGLRLVTVDAPQNSAMDAAFTGTLAVARDGCVYAHPGDGSEVYTLVWPQGYSAQGAEGAFEIVDSDDKVVVRSGSEFELGGGVVDSPRDDWTQKDCAKGSLWLVASPDFSQASQPPIG